jgi:tRNA A37 threonylcarbamoyladenosine biosynthesis protein TsaE
VIFLDGDLGAGKTCLARGFVRALTGDDTLRVTSPTYLLSNTYRATVVVANNDDGDEKKDNNNNHHHHTAAGTTAVEIHHMDLYRLTGDNKPQKDLAPLHLDYVFSKCISLVEWPVRLGDVSPDERLEIDIRIVADDHDEDDAAVDIDDGDNSPRRVTLTPRGAVWEERIRLLRDEGLVDDMLIDDD